MKYTDAWSRALPPVQAKQSMYEAETIDQSCLRESKRNYLPFFATKKERKTEKKRKDKMDTTLSWKPLYSPGFLIIKQTFLYKQDGTAFLRNFSDMLQPL